MALQYPRGSDTSRRSSSSSGGSGRSFSAVGGGDGGGSRRTAALALLKKYVSPWLSQLVPLTKLKKKLPSWAAPLPLNLVLVVVISLSLACLATFLQRNPARGGHAAGASGAAAAGASGMGGGGGGGDGSAGWQRVWREAQDGSLSVAEAVANVVGGGMRTVVVARAKSEEMALVKNWFTSVLLAGYAPQVLFLAEDRAAYDELSQRWGAQTVLVDESKSHEFGGPPGPARVPHYLEALLALGVTVVYNDVDVVWLRNPFWYMRSGTSSSSTSSSNGGGGGDLPSTSSQSTFDAWVAEARPTKETVWNLSAEFRPNVTAAVVAAGPGADKAAQAKVQQLSTCFAVLRPTAGGKALVARWRALVDAAAAAGATASSKSKQSSVDIDTAFDQAVAETTTTSSSPSSHTAAAPVSVGVLPPFSFPSGFTFFPCALDRKTCRRYQRLQRWYAAKHTQGIVKAAVVHHNAAPSRAAVQPALQRAGLWFEPFHSTLVHSSSDSPDDDTEEPEATTAAASGAVGGAAAAAAAGGGLASAGGADAVLRSLAEAVDNVVGADRTVIFASASAGYLDFLLNWFNSVAKAGHDSKVLFFAEDETAFDFLRRRWPKQTVLVVPPSSTAASAGAAGAAAKGAGQRQQRRRVLSAAEASSSSAAHTFGSSSYNELVDRRPWYFECLIRLNVTFLYNDVDIVWFRDPFPFFRGAYDMWVQEDRPRRRGTTREENELFQTSSGNGWRFWPWSSSTSISSSSSSSSSLAPLEGGGCHPALRSSAEYICTCFMLVRPTRGSLALVRLWSKVLRIMQAKEGGQPVPNQPAFNVALQLSRPGSVAVGVLPLLLFPSGFIFFPCSEMEGCEHFERIQSRFWKMRASGDLRPAMMHNNWVSGHSAKLERFKSVRMWSLAAQNDTSQNA